MLGGTSAAIVEADAMIAAMKGGLYPSFFIGPPSARLMTATSAVVDPDISEKNMLKTVTTWDRPPRICPTNASERLATRWTTLEELINSPTRRKNGIASNASVSTPSNTFWTTAASETSVKSAPTNTPAKSANGTGTPRYPKERKQNVINARTTGELTSGALLLRPYRSSQWEVLPSRGDRSRCGSR